MSVAAAADAFYIDFRNPLTHDVGADPRPGPARHAAAAQVHRSVIVNLKQVAQVIRGANETAEVHLRGRNVALPVSRSYLHLFRQM